MRRVLLTGANKGIGLAIARAAVNDQADAFVFLGSRDVARGRAALDVLVAEDPSWKERVEVVAIDVADPASIATAARHVEKVLAGERLHGIVNNAGIGGAAGHADVLKVNVLGVQRTCEAFAPLVADGGRVVNVTSASGPLFVAGCSPEWQRFFMDPALPWEKLRSFVEAIVGSGEDAAALAARGLGEGSPYGLSKACANLYTMIFARENPRLKVNACTPGFIETDMTRHYVVSEGKSPTELGMKSPAEGARAPMFLLFGDVEGTGRYYGSDAKRSPLDRYRAPGSEEFKG
jgi:NAD(P)-dependent dehydrogenase (short-subunit alcohol dehydrogenase family)